MDSVAFASSNGDGRGQMDGPTQQLLASQYSPPPPPCSSPIPDIFSTIRRHCERHLCRLERYKKGGAIFAEDQGEKERPGEMPKNGITKNDEINSSSSSRTTEQQFGELREKMILLVENDMALLVKLLSLGDSLRELRQRTQHQHQLQQQNPAAEMKANEEEEEEERLPRHKTIMAEWEEEEEEEEQHGNADDDKCQKPMNEKRGKWEKKMMTNANGNANANGNVPFPSSSSGRVLPPPPFMGGGRRQRRQPRNPIPAEFIGEEITRLYVWDDEEEDEEDEEEEEKEFPSQNVQYFSRKNSVLRIPIPPRSSNRAFANRRGRQHPPKCPPPHFVRNANNPGCVSSPASAISTEIGAPVSPVIELDSGHSSASEHSPIPPPSAADHHLCSSSSPSSSHPSSIGQSCCFSTISSSTQSSMSFGSSTTEMANIGHQHLNPGMKKCTLNE